MKNELILLREKMAAHNIDYYIIPTTDFHGSEYVNDYFKCRQYISGFTGDAGTLVVSQKEAYLWTDGRFFIQAPMQLKDSGIKVMGIGQPGVPTIAEYLRSKATPYRLGFDGRVISADEGSEYEKLSGVEIIWDLDLINEFWKNRPGIVPSKIYNIPLKVAGKTAEDKIKDVRRKMTAKGADYLLLTTLEEIAWLFNLRGNDINNTPVFFSFALITNVQVELFVMDRAISCKSVQMPNFVKVKSYNDIYVSLERLPVFKSLWINTRYANYTLRKCVPAGIPVITEATPIELMKAIKNPVEIACTINAHERDGAAMVKFIYWLKKNVARGDLTEMSAAVQLDNLRYAAGANDLSFPTIAGYNSNGAVIHYDPQPETNARLKPEGFLLLDSGGQYDDGTTDITRTVALGPLTNKMKAYYTYVLKSHITLATAIFKPGTKGLELDSAARKPLRDQGLDYKHGTGHGVGHLLCVHEGPNCISPSSGKYPILPGMITSNEPGVYIKDEFGIRLENEILCEELENGDYGFRTITLCPFDRDAIVIDLLSSEELQWLNNYHSAVRDVLLPLISTEEAEWLKKATSEI